MPNLLLEFLKEVNPTVAFVCITIHLTLRLALKKIEDFIILFGESKEPARRKVRLLKARHPKA